MGVLLSTVGPGAALALEEFEAQACKPPLATGPFVCARYATAPATIEAGEADTAAIGPANQLPDLLDLITRSRWRLISTSYHATLNDAKANCAGAGALTATGVNWFIAALRRVATDIIETATSLNELIFPFVIPPRPIEPPPPPPGPAPSGRTRITYIIFVDRREDLRVEEPMPGDVQRWLDAILQQPDRFRLISVEEL